MKVSMADVRQAFENLIQEKISREEIANWALERQFANDRDELVYEPMNEKRRIWDAISYLTGVDLLADEKGNYLHCVDDFIDYKKQLGI